MAAAVINIVTVSGVLQDRFQEWEIDAYHWLDVYSREQNREAEAMLLAKQVAIEEEEAERRRPRPKSPVQYKLLPRDDEERIRSERAKYRHGGPYSPEVLRAQEEHAHQVERARMGILEAELCHKAAKEEHEAIWQRQLEERLSLADRWWDETQEDIRLLQEGQRKDSGN